ncbi:MAG TPA: hypothetical protein VK585_01650 [Jiangellaceae bacterium]|nr:hypothetical protein [Jiangellaceae bacterium]
MTLAWPSTFARRVVAEGGGGVALCYYSFMAILMLACAIPHRAVTQR